MTNCDTNKVNKYNLTCTWYQHRISQNPMSIISQSRSRTEWHSRRFAAASCLNTAVSIDSNPYSLPSFHNPLSPPEAPVHRNRRCYTEILELRDRCEGRSAHGTVRTGRRCTRRSGLQSCHSPALEPKSKDGT
jgi:hypothetical protein